MGTTVLEPGLQSLVHSCRLPPDGTPRAFRVVRTGLMLLALHFFLEQAGPPQACSSCGFHSGPLHCRSLPPPAPPGFCFFGTGLQTLLHRSACILHAIQRRQSSFLLSMRLLPTSVSNLRHSTTQKDVFWLSDHLPTSPMEQTCSDQGNHLNLPRCKLSAGTGTHANYGGFMETFSILMVGKTKGSTSAPLILGCHRLPENDAAVALSDPGHLLMRHPARMDSVKSQQNRNPSAGVVLLKVGFCRNTELKWALKTSIQFRVTS